MKPCKQPLTHYNSSGFSTSSPLSVLRPAQQATNPVTNMSQRQNCFSADCLFCRSTWIAHRWLPDPWSPCNSHAVGRTEGGFIDEPVLGVRLFCAHPPLLPNHTPWGPLCRVTGILTHKSYLILSLICVVPTVQPRDPCPLPPRLSLMCWLVIRVSLPLPWHTWTHVCQPYLTSCFIAFNAL